MVQRLLRFLVEVKVEEVDADKDGQEAGDVHEVGAGPEEVDADIEFSVARGTGASKLMETSAACFCNISCRD